MKPLIRVVLFLSFLLFTPLSAGSALADKINDAKLQVDLKKYERYNKARDADLDYLKYQISHHKRVFEAQYYQTILIAVVVHIMIVFGLYLAYLQFRSKESASNKTESEDRTKLEISKDGISLDSNVIGLVILVISFLFYYVYIDSVYVINIK